MMKLAAVFALFGLSNALQCWECENARGDEDCLRIGSLKKCQYNQQTCQVQIRHGGWGSNILVSKACKQAQACDNNYRQNPRNAWAPTQCNLKSPSSLCTCCCNTDECNKGLLSCWDKKVRCEPTLNKPRNGAMWCLDGIEIASECTFACDEGYELDGPVTSVCGDQGQWSSPAPVCRPVSCSPPHAAPFHGNQSCSDANNLGSTCRFTCDLGYVMGGKAISLCQPNGMWSSPAPTCRETECFPSQNAPVNGVVTCSDGSRLESACSFECMEGFSLLGSSRVTCREESGKGIWTASPPTCVAITCRPPNIAPNNGTVRCSKSSLLNSECSFSCNEGTFMIGQSTSVCQASSQGGAFGQWSAALPVCEPITCGDQGGLPHGRIDCTRSNFMTSTCSFTCTTPTYKLYPVDATDNTCQESGTWTRPKPCCARDCPPFAVMDFIVIMDSSSSVGQENWSKMKRFIRNFLGHFSLAPDASHYGIFRYNGKVDTDTQILLSDYPDNMSDMMTAFDAIPYDGSGTKTGQAIQHVVDVILAPGNGNRPGARDIVLILTDGKSQDDVATPSAQLRQSGTSIFVLPIKPPQINPNSPVSLDMQQIRDIAGPDGTIITAAIEGGFEALTEEFAKDISRLICGNPCNHVLHNDE